MDITHMCVEYWRDQELLRLADIVGLLRNVG